MADTKIPWTDATWNPIRGCRAAVALERIRLIAQIGTAVANRACRLLDLVAEIREAYEVASSRAELVERAREMWRAALKMIGPVVTVRARDEEQEEGVGR